MANKKKTGTVKSMTEQPQKHTAGEQPSVTHAGASVAGLTAETVQAIVAAEIAKVSSIIPVKSPEMKDFEAMLSTPEGKKLFAEKLDRVGLKYEAKTVRGEEFDKDSWLVKMDAWQAAPASRGEIIVGGLLVVGGTVYAYSQGWLDPLLEKIQPD